MNNYGLKQNTAACCRRHPSETLAVGRPHHSQDTIQYDKAISHMEPPSEKEEGRPRNTWRRDLNTDAKQMGQTWGQLA
ncbi:hypothetical protein DPMN_078314 [Dreissena polymorpha]|uniref:Uncharacterized protein n=1 Tax=Dreissena polymorpha TaxID=45954 RepID=A0A9D3YM13_DREPO|nr:hypothetical protein DPMN_078314 [Dreissena polymorpha]